MSDRTVVVTGAGSGLGAAVAQSFVGVGTRLVLADPDGDLLADTVDDVSGRGEATGVRTDVRDEYDVELLVETAADGGTQIDCLVVASAVCHERPGETSLSAASYAAFDDHVRTNVRGVFAAVREAAPHLAPDARVVVPIQTADPAAIGGGKHGSYGVSLAGAVAVARGFAADTDFDVAVVETGLAPAADDDADLETAADLIRWVATEPPSADVDGAVLDHSDMTARTDAE